MHKSMPELRTVDVTRYVTPLREGGSLPAIAEADDGFLYVLKFRVQTSRYCQSDTRIPPFL